ncbi:MAG TPA: lysylphosphatidylglycerol synthase transmembrane domain-containing protein [Gemmatimonas sp.]|uniref:lysylphosphatidylglycerol synthase transmembrane domain-containing protein n=1 Tax=Gemmatimonas sp. TaxID=1962908 RepID=UPI002ED87E42
MRSWKTWVGIAFSALLLWWTLRTVDLHEVWGVLRTSNALLFATCTVVATCIFPLRARRWRPILEPVVGSLPFGPLWRSTAIGMMMNNVFPFRAGEFGRAFALTREVPRVPISTALSSLGVDRVFDALVLFGMMFGAMLDPRFPAGATLAGQSIPQLARGGIVFLTLLLIVCYAVVLQPARVIGLVSAIARRVMPRFADVIVGFVEMGIGGLAVLRDTRRFLAVLLWAIAHWGVHALALYLGFMAVGIDVPFSAALFLQGVLGIGVAIPSSPGFFGVFEAAAVAGLGVYGVPNALAISWALGYHLLSFIPITVFGAVYFARLGLSFGNVRQAQGASAET